MRVYINDIYIYKWFINVTYFKEKNFVLETKTKSSRPIARHSMGECLKKLLSTSKRAEKGEERMGSKENALVPE